MHLRRGTVLVAAILREGVLQVEFGDAGEEFVGHLHHIHAAQHVMAGIHDQIDIIGIGQLHHPAEVVLALHRAPHMRMQRQPHAVFLGAHADLVGGIGQALELVVAGAARRTRPPYCSSSGRCPAAAGSRGRPLPSRRSTAPGLRHPARDRPCRCRRNGFAGRRGKSPTQAICTPISSASFFNSSGLSRYCTTWAE